MLIALLSLAVFSAACVAIIAVIATTLVPAMPRIVALLRSGGEVDEQYTVVVYPALARSADSKFRSVMPQRRRMLQQRVAA